MNDRVYRYIGYGQKLHIFNGNSFGALCGLGPWQSGNSVMMPAPKTDDIVCKVCLRRLRADKDTK